MSDSNDQNKTEKEYMKVKKEYQHLFNSLNDPVLVHDYDGNFLAVNEAATKYLGYSEEEWLSMNLLDIVAPKSAGRIENRKRKLEDEKTLVFESTHITKEGEKVPVETSTTLTTYRGDPVFLSIIRDITRRKETEKKLRENLERYRDLFNSIKTKVVVHGADGSILSANPAAEELFGLSEEQLKEKHMEFWQGKLYTEQGKPMDPSEFPVSRVLASGRPVEGLVVGVAMAEEDEKQWQTLSAVPQFNEKGDLERIINTFKDITKRKRAEEAIKKTEERFKKLFDANPDAAFLVDRKGVFKEVNEAACELSGYNREELIGTSIRDAPPLPKSTQEALVEQFQRRLQGEDLSPYTIKIKRKNGELRYVEVNTNPIEEDERFTGIIGVARDITERKNTESNLRHAINQLRASREKYRTVFENTGTATVIIEGDTTISLANEKFEELSGYCKEEIEGKKSWTEFVVKQDLKRMKEFHELRRKDPASAPKRYEFQFVDKAGEVHDILLTIDVIPGTQKSVASLLDITERKNMEAELRRREEKYRLLAENTGDVIFVQDMDHNLTYVSPSVKDVSGYSVEEAVHLHMGELMTPQSRKRAMQNFQKYVAIAREREEVSIPLMEYEYIKKDGSTFWGELKVRFLRDGEGQLIGSQGVLRDITTRKEAEEKLETLHAWAQKLNRAKKLDDIFEFTLDAMEQTLGFSHASIQLKKGHSLELEAYRGFKSFPQELRRLPLDGTGITVKAANTGKTILLNDVMQHPNYLDVSPRLKSELAVPIKIQKELIGILNVESEEVNAFDQRDRRLLEMLAAHVAVAIKELWEKKKRVSLQRLDELRNRFLAMAAHEINTPLTPIKTDLEMLQRGYHGDLTEEQEHKITKVLESVNRLDRLVTDFRRISKLRTQQITLEKSEHKLANTIEEAIAQFKYALAEEGILLIKNIQKPLSATYDHGRLMQVIRNLMENAIDYTENRIWIKVWEKGDSVCVAVRDNGPGIPRKAQKTIFKPFSRVEEERDRENRRFGGTGLGLYVCKQIIQAHHGTLHVESTPGEGASFTICLPKHGRT